MTPPALPHHRVPPGLLMVMSHDEVEALAEWNGSLVNGVRWDHVASAEELAAAIARNWAMAIEQWRFNVATREALLDGGATPHPSGGYVGDVGAESRHTRGEALNWHFPQRRRECPDAGTCHHECEPLAGCWRVATCGPLSVHGETWSLAERIAHERFWGTL